MRIVKRLIIVVAICLTPTFAQAQTCLGLPANRPAYANVKGKMAFTEGSRSYLGRVGYGGATGFVGGSVAYHTFTDSDAHANTFSLDAGTSLARTSSTRVHVCPIAEVSYSTGPNHPDFGFIKRSSFGLIAGISVGGEMVSTPTTTLVPHFTGGFAYVRGTSRSTISQQSITTKSSDNGITLLAGLSLIFERTVAITPAAGIVLGHEGGLAHALTLSSSMSFGP